MASDDRLPLPDGLPTMSELKPLIAPYARASVRRSVFQLANTLIPYIGLWVLMYFSLRVSYALTLALAVLASGFMVRLFIFFHDCGHNSFLPSTRWNRIVGAALGVLVFTPGEQWWHSHAIHHATSGNLDKRGTGDVNTLTLDEYYESRWQGRLGYRLFRNPLIMFGLGPLYMFLISHRLALPKYGPKETASVIWTNLAILGMAAGLSLLFGFKEYLIIQLPVLWIGGAVGIWMFYLQHQFEDTYWEREGEWNYVASALLGASYYQLPKVLQWFTGNIGFHHVHHLSPRIPNYNLEPAHINIPQIQKWARVIRFREGLRLTRLKVWDETMKSLVEFRHPAPARAPAGKKEISAGD